MGGISRLSGWAAVLGLITTWIAQSEVSSSLQTRLATPYDRPFAITWFNHSLLLLCLPVALLLHRRRPPTPAPDEAPLLSVQAPAPAPGAWPVLAAPRRLAGAVMLLAVLYVASDYAWYRALGVKGFSVTEATALGNSGAAFAFLLSICILGERVTGPKLAALALSLGGVAAAAAGSGGRSGGGTAMLAPALATVFAAFAYSLYEVVFSALVSRGRTLSAAEVNLVCGLIGAAHVFLIPLFPLLDSLGVEPFLLPTAAQWPWVLLNASLALAFNWCLLLALAALGPVLVSVASLSTIPLSAATDAATRHSVCYDPLCVAGYLLIFAGLALMTWADSRTPHNHRA